MLPEIWKKEIINIPVRTGKPGWNKDVDWVEETAQQLIKDFTILDIPLSFQPSAENQYQDLFDQARSTIKDLFEKNYHVFLNLLYRIDLPEAELNKLINNPSSPNLYDEITELVLRREFMKVVTRHLYS